MSLDTTLRNLAASTLKKYGRTVTMTRPATASGTYDIATSSVANGVAQSFTCKASIMRHERDSRDGLVQRGDISVIIAAADAGFEPRAHDRVKVDNVTYEVLEATISQGIETPVIYEMRARK